jgi:hypothetical protein
MDQEKKLLKTIRLWTVFFILALVGSGITAFPLLWEMELLCNILSISPHNPPEVYTGLERWIITVYRGLIDTHTNYPFLAYGTDWLAFSHLVIATAFIGVYTKPVRNHWIVYFGMIACIGVIPLALICGSIRQIPFYWRLIDCSFGIFGMIPLIILHKLINRLELLVGKLEYKY